MAGSHRGWRPRTGHRAEGAEPAAQRRRRAEQRAEEKRRSGKQEKTGKCGRKPWKMMPRRVQNGGKMAPKWLPGGLWATLGRRLCFQRLPGALLEGLWGGPGVPKNSLLAPWGPPGAKSWSISCFRGAAGGSRGGFGRPFWRHFCRKAWRHEKSHKFIRIFFILAPFFGCILFQFLRLPGGAGARAHLRKTGFHVESVAFFACPAFARGTKKRRNFEEKQ